MDNKAIIICILIIGSIIPIVSLLGYLGDISNGIVIGWAIKGALIGLLSISFMYILIKYKA